MDQLQLYWLAHRRIAEENNHFLEMISDPYNPLTSHDLELLIERYPSRWGRFEKFIPTLRDKESASKLTINS